ncbi:hypothetical protein ACLMJV_30855 [Sinorhizobium meliloti]|uniref:hypothetical protein n=1 Tax=Rhizobium meliloti TaxID=382 RepID=UPI0030867844|nr:hypothetical protein U8C33_38095 [Sinorhizobium meliloti]
MSRFTSQKPAYIKWRVDQMRANSRIQGMEPDPRYTDFTAQMDAEGVPVEEQIERFQAFLGVVKAE